MAIVQFQRFNKRGDVVEYFFRDVANHRAYLDVIEPLDRVARHDDGSTRTVAEGSPLWIGELPDQDRPRDTDRPWRRPAVRACAEVFA